MEKEESGGDRYRDWAWTFQNVEDSEKLKKWLTWLEANSRYTVFQPEECPKTGKIHLQGYSEFKTAIRLGTMVALDTGVHLERRWHPDRNKAREYCMKDDTAVGDYVEFGEWKEVGHTDAWTGMMRDIKNGMHITEVASTHYKTFGRYHKGVRSVMELSLKTPTNEFIQGSIDEEDVPIYVQDKGFDECYWKHERLYGLHEGSTKILLEAKGIPKSLLKKMLRGYPISVPVPGGQMRWSPQVVLLVQCGEGNTEASPQLSPVKKIEKVQRDANKRRVLEY